MHKNNKTGFFSDCFITKIPKKNANSERKLHIKQLNLFRYQITKI